MFIMHGSFLLHSLMHPLWPQFSDDNMQEKKLSRDRVECALLVLKAFVGGWTRAPGCRFDDSYSKPVL